MIEVSNCTGTKYEGARWLKKGIQPLSPLAVRVANVLGQVFSGVYNVDASEKQLAKLRSPASEYALTIFGGMATTDFDKLTRLLLCCQAAGLNVSIAGSVTGSVKGALKLTFKYEYATSPPLIQSLEVPDFEALADFESKDWRQVLKYPLVRRLDHKSKFLTVGWDVENNGDRTISAFSMRSESISMIRLKEIVSRAHSACCRAEIEGRTATGMGQIGLYWSKRSRTAQSTMEGHPTPEDAIEKLRHFWDIDYTRLD